jgi:hypothetical protein
MVFSCGETVKRSMWGGGEVPSNTARYDSEAIRRRSIALVDLFPIYSYGTKTENVLSSNAKLLNPKKLTRFKKDSVLQQISTYFA